jgi:hypothetical protein
MLFRSTDYCWCNLVGAVSPFRSSPPTISRHEVEKRLPDCFWAAGVSGRPVKIIGKLGVQRNNHDART